MTRFAWVHDPVALLDRMEDAADVPPALAAALICEGVRENPHRRDPAVWLAELGERAEAGILVRQARGLPTMHVEPIA